MTRLRPSTRGLYPSLRPLSFAALVVSAVTAPAFDGRADAAVPTGFVDEPLAENLDSPVGLAFLPDGRLLVTEQFTANVKVIPVGGGAATTIFTVPDVVSGSERGLLGVVPDPEWPDRPYLYFDFSHSGSVIYVRMYTVTGDLTDPFSTDLTLSDPYNILVDIPDFAFNHNGGTLRFDTTGMLLVSTGDDASSCNSQDVTSLAGNILRLDVTGLPGAGSGPPDKSDITPSDNPIPSANENTALIYCYGLRNPFRFSVDHVTGNLYIGDVGSGSWEEFDEASGGENFGWPLREGAHAGPNPGCPGATGLDPIWEYPNGPGSAAVIGGPRYRVQGALAFPVAYEGDLFVHDYYAGDLKRLTFDGAGWVIADPVAGQPSATTWANGLSGAADMVLGADGALYYPNQFTGSVRRIANANVVGVEPGPAPPIDRELVVRPNPASARGTLTISYVAQSSGEVRLSIFDVSGSRVALLADTRRVAGRHEIAWDGRGPGDEALSPGVYFVRLEGPAVETTTTKLTLTR